jgi:MFS family permease
MITRVESGAPKASVVPWWHNVTLYQWFTFAVVSGAWLFDNLDQRLFSLARIPALTNLMSGSADALEIQAFAKIVTALFLVGWGIGGLTIGALGDRFGRVRWLTIATLIYSIGTGLTAICETGWQFAMLRLITGLGIGGIFGLAVAIIAESVSSAARLAMLALLQVLSTVGNIGAALVKMVVDSLASNGVVAADGSWRWLFALGALPALLTAASGLYLKESKSWLRLQETDALPKSWFGSYGALLSDREDRRNLILGTALAIAGVVGLWGIGEYAVDLQHAVFTAYFTTQNPGADVPSQVAHAKNWAYLLQMIGAALGMLGFTYIAGRFGRRPAFIAGFSSAFLMTLFVYLRLETPQDAYWMMLLTGAAQFSVFAGFSIYLPELFDAKVRGTGVSFAYNLGRFAAAGGSFVSAALTTHVFNGFPSPAPLRYSAMTMCSVFLVGLVAAWYAPETLGQPLRE